MTTLYLVRHGEYENPDYVFPYSDRGFPLSKTGREQVERLAGYFKNRPVRAIYASPVPRTQETASILGAALGVPVRTDARLKEVVTHLEGTSMKRFDETRGELGFFPENIARGAESMEALANRVHGALEDIRKAETGKETVIVTHGDPLRFSLMKYLGMPLEFDLSRTVATPLAAGYRLTFDDATGACAAAPIP